MTLDIQEETNSDESKEFLTMIVGGQMFGVPVLQVQDVLGERSLTRVPLAPPEISGAMNLRGRIVTAVDLRHKLDMEKKPDGAESMYIVVEHNNELYSLIVDDVGDVLSLPDKDFEKTPSTIDPSWRDLSVGIYRLDGRLLVILNVPHMLEEICEITREDMVA